jgi:hypothetical protein
MPYIVTTKQRVPNWDGVGDAPLMRGFRRAVATLEKARDTIREQTGYFYDGKLPESGGTVGPLPDGTEIEVERMTWFALAAVASSVRITVQMADRAAKGDVADQRRICDAYNARQA